MFKAVDTIDAQKTSNIIERLNQLGYYDTDGKTDRELAVALVREQAREIDITHEANKYF